MPTWVLILIGLLIIGIILDGVRRVRLHRKENIRISRRAKLADRELQDADRDSLSAHGSDFPSGGARVIGARETPLDASKSEDESFTDNENQQYENEVSAGQSSPPNRLPEQVTLNLDETIPMLMESLDEKVHPSTKSAESSLGVLATAPGDVDEHGSYALDLEQKEPVIGSLDDIDTVDSPNEKQAFSQGELIDADAKTHKKTKGKLKTKPKRSAKKKGASAKNNVEKKEPEEVIIVNIMAKSGELFSGDELLHALIENHFKFGDMDIFHRHVDRNGEGGTLFSIANMVVPGTFNLAEMSEFQSPGVSMFMTLPVEEESLIAFDLMIKAARSISRILGGELKDENRSVMTNQTIEHARQKVIEYERLRKLHAR